MSKPTQAKRPPQAASLKQEQRPATVEWKEHVSEAAQAAAVRLLDTAGSAEIAKHAIDVDDERQETSPTAHHELAVRVGFASYLDLASTSMRIGGAGDGAPEWYITPLPSGRWIAWNDVDLREQDFPTHAAAEDGVSQFTGM